MALPEPYSFFIDPLEQLGSTYCITGSVAAGLYGEPRVTRDIDVVMLLQTGELREFLQVFPEESFYVPPIDVLITETQRSGRGVFNLIHHATGYKADIFVAARDPLHKWALRHRRRQPYNADVPGVDLLWVAPPEYVIIRKLEYFREGGSDKHLRDISFMLKTTQTDAAFIEKQVARLGLNAQWQVAASFG